MDDISWDELAYTLFEEAGDALFLFDPETEQIRDANPMAQRLSNFGRRDLLQMKVTYLFRSDVPKGMEHFRQAFRRTGLFHSQEGFWLRCQGVASWIPINVTITRLHAADRTLGLVTARDISSQRETQAKLKKAEEELRQVTTSVSDCLWSASVDRAGHWTYRYFSPVIIKVAGRPAEFFMSGPDRWFGIVLAEDRPRVEEAFARFKAGRSGQEEYRVVWPDQEIHWVRDSVLALEEDDGRSIALHGVLSDISERKRAEEELRETNFFLDSIVENIPNMLFVKKAQTLQFERINKAGEDFLGRGKKDIIGKTDYELFPKAEADFFIEKDLEALTSKKLVDIPEETIRTESGERILHTMKIPILDERGNATHLLGISADITDRKRLEEQFRQLQKMEAVGRLAGGVAHDFNNLLTAILGNLELVEMELPPGHSSRELLADSLRAGFRAAELTRQLLSFARQTAIRPESVDLNACVIETVRLVGRTFDPRIQVDLQLEPDLWRVRADSTQIGQVLMNLSLNARDAMPKGGTLRLETNNVTLDEEQAAARLEMLPGEFVYLSVRDSGQGMPSGVQEHIFEPFFTTKEQGKGTGLGLAMVFGIVKQHGGWIECLSTLGEGTSFDVYLPRLQAEQEKELPAPDQNAPRGYETILLADDQEMIRRLAQDILERHGYRVLTVADGAEAVDTYRDRFREIDLVILDLAMPRLSGQDAFNQMRQLNPAVLAIISSGYLTDETYAALERAGVSGFVAKPYRPIELARTVRAILDKTP